jgi:hypothetical protein
MSFERDLRERGPFINHASAREAAREKIGEGGKKKERKKEKKEKRVSLLFRDAPSSSGEMMTTENRREWLLTAAAMSIHIHTHTHTHTQQFPALCMLHLGQASRPAAFYRMETIPSLRPHSAMHMHLYIERWRDRERSIIKYHRSIIFRRGGRGGREQRQITRWLL